MYNRYIPQSDGSFRRSRMPDQPTRQEPPRQEQRRTCPPPPPPQEDCRETPQPCRQQRCGRQNPPPRQNRSPRQDGGSVSGFLKQLLPKDFDTGDLLVVLLLLLMSADSCEDQNTALLTLALYLFM